MLELKAEQLRKYAIDHLNLGDVLPVGAKIEITVYASPTDIQAFKKIIPSEHRYKSPVGLMAFLATAIERGIYPFDFPVVFTRDIWEENEYKRRFSEIGPYKFGRAMKELNHVKTKMSLLNPDGEALPAWIIRQHKTMSLKTKKELEDIVNNGRGTKYEIPPENLKDTIIDETNYD